MLPGAPRVGRLVNAVADGEIGPAQAFSAAHIDNIGIRRRYRQRSDGAGRLAIEDRVPGSAEVRRLPNAAVVWSHVEDVLVLRNAGDRHRAAAAKWPDQPPMKLLIERWVIWLGRKRGRKNENTERGKHNPHESLVHSFPQYFP